MRLIGDATFMRNVALSTIDMDDDSPREWRLPKSSVRNFW